MSKLTVFRGYSGSGKTTLARQLPGLKVSRDELRTMLYGAHTKTVLTPEQEEEVTRTAHGIAKRALLDGQDVVVHDTNLNNQFYDQWLRLAQKCHADFEGVWLTEDDPTVLKRRNFIRQNAERVPDSVIDRQLKRFPVTKWKGLKQWTAPKFERDLTLPDRPRAVIVDLDGTLALNTGGRSIYDGSRAGEDTLNYELAEAIQHRPWVELVFCSGRSDEHRQVTQDWLERHGYPDPTLHMRKAGDTRLDWVVKGEIFKEHIEPFFDVVLAIDDRDQVVKLWRDLGIPTWQVAEGDF